jgi:predicted PhzF superfamily epimerase YddE/YHI9
MTAPFQAALVEAFAEAPLGGNGAGVVLLNQPAPAAWMQAVARRLQQSETAFLWSGPEGTWCLRWFTPSCEVPLCGHATLAAVLALGHWGRVALGQDLALQSRSGPLAVRLESLEPASARLVLPSSGLDPLPVPAYLEALLGEPPLAYWGSPLGYRVALMAQGYGLAALAVPSEQLEGQDRQGLVVMQTLHRGTAPSQPRVLAQPADYQLRFFAPGLGISEDPVTGSAHALVAPYWQKRLGQTTVVGWQASPSPGGMVCAEAGAGRIALTGRGHLLWDGQLAGGSPTPDLADWSVCDP